MILCFHHFLPLSYICQIEDVVNHGFSSVLTLTQTISLSKKTGLYPLHQAHHLLLSNVEFNCMAELKRKPNRFVNAPCLRTFSKRVSFSSGPNRRHVNERRNFIENYAVINEPSLHKQCPRYAFSTFATPDNIFTFPS